MSDSDEGSRTWRPLLIGRISFAVIGVATSVGALAVAVSAVVSGDFAELLLPVVMAAWAVPLLLALRMRITLGVDCLEYRNFGGAHRLPWGEVRGAVAGYYGITLTLTGSGESARRTTVARAVQKSNMAQWFGWDTRADRVVELIEQRCGPRDDLDSPPVS